MNYIINLIPILLLGLKNTLLIFIVILLFSLPLGIFISLGRLAKNNIINKIFQFYIYIMRGTPLLLQIIFIYFGLPTIGITFNRFTAIYIAFILNYAAYFGEIFKGGIISIDKGQYEASAVLGISRFNSFIFIILPQVIKRTVSSIANEVITLVKDTSLIYVVGIGELLRAAKNASNRDASLIPFLLAGIIYLLITSILTKIFENIEKKYNYYE